MEEYDNLPQYVQSIIDTWDDNQEIYSECKRIQQELNNVGWDCDYGLDGDIFDITLLPYNHEWKVRGIMAKIVTLVPNRLDINFGENMVVFVNNGKISLTIGDEVFYHDNVYKEFHHTFLEKIFKFLQKQVADVNWQMLADVPVNIDEEIDIDFILTNGTKFEKGTEVSDIWYYFEDFFDVTVGEM